MNEWQPIETAPKDGTRVLVAFGRGIGVHAVGWNGVWYVDDRKHGPYPLRGYVEQDQLGWMPLPNPPKQETK